MEKIPTLIWGKNNDTSVETQFGCVYCLAEGLESPSDSHVVYLYQGTTMCARHVRSIVGGQS